MEPGIKEFFKRLSASIGMCVLWMAVNMVIGVKHGYAFFESGLRWSNIVFYVWIVISFIALIFFYKWLWKKPIENLDN